MMPLMAVLLLLIKNGEHAGLYRGSVFLYGAMLKVRG